MDGTPAPSEIDIASAVIRTACVRVGETGLATGLLMAQLGDGPFALIKLFCDPKTDLNHLIDTMQSHYPDATIIACTTAGEISTTGYTTNRVVATALPAKLFATNTIVFEKLHLQEKHEIIGRVIRAKAALAEAAPEMEHKFASLLIDGLSLKEDIFASALASGLGNVPLFGGSAGDGTRFENTFVVANGKVMRNAAVLCLVQTHCPVKVFTLNHFKPTDQRMVVTSADPLRRIVHTINAEPAARELARILGNDPGQIDTFTFASSPVVVRIGGSHHVRAIKCVTDEGHLEFFSAIDEGLVLTLAKPQDMVAHLKMQFAAMAADQKPAAVIAYDCVLRRIEAEQGQLTRSISKVLSANNVTGFSTYGEQINAMHVNQTMTGVAIYPPIGPH